MLADLVNDRTHEECSISFSKSSLFEAHSDILTYSIQQKEACQLLANTVEKCMTNEQLRRGFAGVRKHKKFDRHNLLAYVFV